MQFWNSKVSIAVVKILHFTLKRKWIKYLYTHSNAFSFFTVRMLEEAKKGYVIDPNEYQQLNQEYQASAADSSDGDEQDFSRRSKKMKTSYQT